jgi:ribosomal protein S18 acetylase RimI-like enzyme
MNYRFAVVDDCPLLGQWNHQLIRDEGHRNPMTVAELEQRMRDFLAGEYQAILFEDAGQAVGYALFRERVDEIYLRQLYIIPGRRRQGLGRQSMQILREKIWPKDKRLTVEVLIGNTAAIAFWRAVGYKDYCLALEILPGGVGLKSLNRFAGNDICNQVS